MINHNKGIKNNFTVLGSAHNIREIQIKKNQKIDIIFMSPLYKSNKNKEYLGITKVNLIRKNFEEKFVALGGINNKNKSMLKLLNITGYAAISYFKINN